jgi:hypothetical protein
MSLDSFRDGLAERRRSALFLFYLYALVSAIAVDRPDLLVQEK